MTRYVPLSTTAEQASGTVEFVGGQKNIISGELYMPIRLELEARAHENVLCISMQ